MVLYSAVSSPLDRSKRFTLSSPGRPVHSDTVLGFSWKHSNHAAMVIVSCETQECFDLKPCWSFDSLLCVSR